jgi:hypothetical protein
MGRWGGGYIIAWLLDELGYRVMVDWMNEIMFAWAHGSRDGTYGKVHKLQIPNPKERGTPVLLINRGQLTLFPIPPLPHPPISPTPLHPFTPIHLSFSKNLPAICAIRGKKIKILLPHTQHSDKIGKWRHAITF